jgi:hypothetical protein
MTCTWSPRCRPSPSIGSADCASDAPEGADTRRMLCTGSPSRAGSALPLARVTSTFRPSFGRSACPALRARSCLLPAPVGISSRIASPACSRPPAVRGQLSWLMVTASPSASPSSSTSIATRYLCLAPLGRPAHVADVNPLKLARSLGCNGVPDQNPPAEASSASKLP